MNVFVGCTMINNIDEKLKKTANSLAKELADNNYNLVFGACNQGLMGIMYNVMKSKGRYITGIIADIYKDDLLELNCDKEIIVTSIIDRNNKFLEHSDAMIFLEGGVGTLGELFVLLEAKKSTNLNIPIVILNENGYYDSLIEQFIVMHKYNILKEKELNNFYVSNSVEDCIKYLSDYSSEAAI